MNKEFIALYSCRNSVWKSWGVSISPSLANIHCVYKVLVWSILSYGSLVWWCALKFNVNTSKFHEMLWCPSNLCCILHDRVCQLATYLQPWGLMELRFWFQVVMYWTVPTAADTYRQIGEGMRRNHLLLQVAWKLQCFSNRDLCDHGSGRIPTENEITEPVTFYVNNKNSKALKASELSTINSDAILRCRTGLRKFVHYYPATLGTWSL